MTASDWPPDVGFMDQGFLLDVGPRQFPRQIERLLWHLGFLDVVAVDDDTQRGAYILGRYGDQDWVFRCQWRRRGVVGSDIVDEAALARDRYGTTKAAAVTNVQYGADARRRAAALANVGARIALWSGDLLNRAHHKAADRYAEVRLRPYQREAFLRLHADLQHRGTALLVLATGLGKTVVGGAVIDDHLRRDPRATVLVVAHTKDLVAQLERALWPHLSKDVPTRLLTGEERPDDLTGVTCATVGTALAAARFGYRPGLVMVDEAHHVGGDGQYTELLIHLADAPQFGVTATPWRGDAYDITNHFGEASYTLGIEEGMRQGYLARVDYRLYVDNVDWDTVRAASRHSYSLGELNARLFLPQRDEAIRDELGAIWSATPNPRGIVFCRTIEHADRLARFLTGVSPWSKALAVHADLPRGERQNRLLQFRSGDVPLLTSVDILNEGVDVPDVNILCFARVTHSRRIFVQQLGRGLRLREGKNSVVVLDFVSDLRRIAAALNIRRALTHDQIEVLAGASHSHVSFSDQRVETLMDKWIKDAASLETAYDEHRLQFPSALAPTE